MTERGQEIARAMARTFEEVREHDKTAPDDVDEILRALISTLRAWKPEALKATLETGPVAKVDLSP